MIATRATKEASVSLVMLNAAEGTCRNLPGGEVVKASGSLFVVGFDYCALVVRL